MNIQSLFSEWQALQPMSAENQRRLNDKFMLEFNYNSNHIEGNTLTYGQTMLLLIQGKVDGAAPMRDYEEMKAHHAALEFVKQTAKEKERPLTEAFIRQVHQIMLKEDYTVYETRGGKQIQYTIHAGIYKTRPNSVKTQTGEIFEYASPEETPILMADLVAWYNLERDKNKLSPIQLAALFHYRYIRIHPFEDGNGRIARLMVNYILSLFGYPMIVVHTEDKNNYLGALEKCDNVVGKIPSNGAHATLEQISPLVEYLEKCLERALVISIKAAKGENIEEEDDLQKKLAILARNAQEKRGNIKRKSNQYVQEVFSCFLFPFQEKLRERIGMFSQFYSKIEVSILTIYQTGATTLLSPQYLEKNQDRLYNISSNMLIQIMLRNPTVLLPVGSFEGVHFYIQCNEEGYETTLYGEKVSFRYGVLPTESQQKGWIKRISEDVYKSIERKVADAK